MSLLCIASELSINNLKSTEKNVKGFSLFIFSSNGSVCTMDFGNNDVKESELCVLTLNLKVWSDLTELASNDWLL